MEEPKTLEDWKEIGENHFELVETLHNNMEVIPPVLLEKLDGLMYKHWEP